VQKLPNLSGKGYPGVFVAHVCVEIRSQTHAKTADMADPASSNPDRLVEGFLRSSLTRCARRVPKRSRLD
jgi:hypothetical protein